MSARQAAAGLGLGRYITGHKPNCSDRTIHKAAAAAAAAAHLRHPLLASV